MTITKFKFLEHTGDAKFLATGKNIEEAFKNSTLALKEITCGKIKISNKIEKKIKAKGKDYESLLYKFLEEIIYLLDAENFLTARVKNIKIKGFELTAVLIGDKASNYKFTDNVKAITYHEMKIEKAKGKWMIQAVVDT